MGLSVLHGQDPDDRHRGCPIRERWGLGNHQQLSFAFQDKLAFTATATASYADAAALAEKLGSPVSAMTDGWTVRQRGLGWGKKKTKEKRVERRGWKTGVCFQMERCVRTKGERGMITDTRVTGWQGDPVGSGVRLHREAMRAGPGRAQEHLVVGDGAVWIWKLTEDRWPEASRHLWEVGKALEGEDEERVRAWVGPRRHRLRTGGQKKVLEELAGSRCKEGASGTVVKREQEHFAGHEHRMEHQTTHRKGWPIGSGAVESACRQRQCRSRRPGQFRTATGMRNLGALTKARHNLHWEELRTGL